ncbi:MAG: nitroreductase [Pseudomonadales bacterium]|nr:nitroreductase [Pseudomonadales bacterium]
MQVTQAVQKRSSIRAFTDQPVSNGLIRELIEGASRAPSGGNVQPWQLYVFNGDAMVRFKQHVRENPRRETPGYAIYPENLKEPHRSARFEVGEMMYALLEIPRDDKAARLQRLAQNFQFFGAPAGFFCFIDEQMGPPQWSDLGMFLQTFMLLATEAGLATCAQEAWATKPQTVAEYVDAPGTSMLFCGMAIGYEDTTAAVNTLRSHRFPVDSFTTFIS